MRDVGGALMGAAKWIEQLELYGPMALLVFLIFIVLPKAKPTESLNEPLKRVHIGASIGVWIGIFACGVVIVCAWWRVNFPSEYILRGVIRNLRSPESI
jgi:hypothetical protein